MTCWIVYEFLFVFFMQICQCFILYLAVYKIKNKCTKKEVPHVIFFCTFMLECQKLFSLNYMCRKLCLSRTCVLEIIFIFCSFHTVHFHFINVFFFTCPGGLFFFLQVRTIVQIVQNVFFFVWFFFQWSICPTEEPHGSSEPVFLIVWKQNFH